MAIHTRWLLHLTIVSALLSLTAAKDSIAPGELVRDADSLTSADGRFRLGFFTPGTSKFRYLGIWFNTVSVRTVIWVANGDRPISGSTGVLSISGNGSLVLADANGTVYWSTGAPTGVTNPVARLLNTSNFVVTGASGGDYAWQSFDHPTDTMVPGMKLGWSRSSGMNRSLMSWKSSDDPAPGEYTSALDVRGDPQLFLMRGTKRIWRTGPWMGQTFTGIPEMSSYSALFKFAFSNDADEVAFGYDTVNRSLLTRLVLHPTGFVERVVWNENTQTWNQYWYAPKDKCDNWGYCGPFGVCDTSYSPLCRCVQGFVPRSPENWNRRDATEGCVRRTPLDCRNGTDGFEKVAQVKLPDTSAALVVNNTMGQEDCRTACLKNCACAAYANAVVAGGRRGCILWGGNVTDVRVNPNGGEDLFVRLAGADLGSSSTSADRRLVVGITVAAAVLGLLVLGWTGWCLWKRRRRWKTTTVVIGAATTGVSSHMNEERRRGDDHEDLELPLFDFSTVAAATHDFSAENKLGEGGFGPVFKGRMEDKQEVAVKRLARNSTQGVNEFKNEVMLIAKLQHRNLVRLLGCCIEGEERMLIYEYMPNKSLDAFLFDKAKAAELDWRRRFHIINGVARGLLYLHQDSRFRIIHRDLKASNILLDKDMNPKISDFGMARIVGGDQTEANTRRVVGTYGYMSPEYIMDGVFSVKSDVFSFGVLVLEIVSGKKNRGIYLSDPNHNLLGNAWSLWKAGNWMQLADASMEEGFLVAEVLRCINLGLLCVQERPEGRPTMAWVVQMLGNDTETSLLPQPKQPGFMATRGPFEVSSSGSVNEATATMFEGR